MTDYAMLIVKAVKILYIGFWIWGTACMLVFLFMGHWMAESPGFKDEFGLQWMVDNYVALMPIAAFGLYSGFSGMIMGYLAFRELNV